MRFVLCETASKQRYIAAVKARDDFKKIAIESGYHMNVLFHNGNFKPYCLCELMAGCIKTIIQAKKDDEVLIQYPYDPEWVNRLFLRIMRFGKRCKGYKVTVLIHDVRALRQGISHPDPSLSCLAGEVQGWDWADRVICHNDAMRAILARSRPYDNYDILGIFDYLYDGPVCKREYDPNPRVMIAGNLNRLKCGYVYRLDAVDNVLFDLYGPNYAGDSAGNVRYCGKYPPDELIGHLDGQFGLVWDGDDVETCSGDYGEYLRYNNPFKFSMYLAAGVPVIIWRQAALARYVTERGVGVCVDSLLELHDVLGNMSEAEYYQICQNVEKVRMDITCGNQLRRVI